MFQNLINWWNRGKIARTAADKWFEDLGWEDDPEGDYLKGLPPNAKHYVRKKLVEWCLSEGIHPIQAKSIRVAKEMRLIPRDTADTLLRLQVERYCGSCYAASYPDTRGMVLAAYGLHTVPVDIAAKIVRQEIRTAPKDNGMIFDGFWQGMSDELIVYMLPKDRTSNEWKQFVDTMANQGELDLLERSSVFREYLDDERRRTCLEGCLKNLTVSWRYAGYAVKLIKHFGEITTAKELLNRLIGMTNPDYVGFINSLKIFLEKRGIPLFSEAAKNPAEHS